MGEFEQVGFGEGIELIKDSLATPDNPSTIVKQMFPTLAIVTRPLIPLNTHPIVLELCIAQPINPKDIEPYLPQVENV